ncbi:hypothetical protein ACE103_08940 [Bradyrhizobium sp. ma5]|uniref:hypothetical protein n=1 Tax=Bradyrhizobium sp. ma5 TaxID=3344828 RepID=UPI0035D496B4
MTSKMLLFQTAGKSSLTALAWSIGEYWWAHKQTSEPASSMSFRMGSGVFTPVTDCGYGDPDCAGCRCFQRARRRRA